MEFRGDGRPSLAELGDQLGLGKPECLVTLDGPLHFLEGCEYGCDGGVEGGRHVLRVGAHSSYFKQLLDSGASAFYGFLITFKHSLEGGRRCNAERLYMPLQRHDTTENRTAPAPGLQSQARA